MPFEGQSKKKWVDEDGWSVGLKCELMMCSIVGPLKWPSVIQGHLIKKKKIDARQRAADKTASCVTKPGGECTAVNKNKLK